MTVEIPTLRLVRLVLAAAALAGGVGVWPEAPAVRAQAPATEGARRAQEAAWDENTPGPNQPIPFSHAIHAGTYGMQCLYCHTGSDRSPAAGVPSVQVCMGCHLHVGQDLEGVQLLKRYWEEKRPVEWVQIHRLPEHVQFRHNRHVAAGVACQACHGPVDTMDKLALVADTKWWAWGLPTQKLQMGWCVQCHRENGASQDCVVCHY